MKEWQTSAAPRVLIADDQTDVLEALRLLLKGEGYQPLLVFGETNSELPSMVNVAPLPAWPQLPPLSERYRPWAGMVAPGRRSREIVN